MTETTYRNRRAFQLDASGVRVTVLSEGGHVAEIAHEPTGVNPLWTPPWPTMDHSRYDPEEDAEYGNNAESRLLAGIMGHNICLDIFGPPSAEEAAAGLDVHGEAPTAKYDITEEQGAMMCRAELPEAGLSFTRRLSVAAGVVSFSETVANRRAVDRPIAWTQHATLGPPFLENGVTRFRVTGTRSKVTAEMIPKCPYARGEEFLWPNVPLAGGGTDSLETFTSTPVSGAFTATLMDPSRDHVWFAAWHPRTKLLFGYIWRRADFPWLGRWEENRSREQPPWNGETLALGMEFGVSPMAETRRQMIDRNSLFGTPAYKWVPAKSEVKVDFCAFIRTADGLPEDVVWDGSRTVAFN